MSPGKVEPLRSHLFRVPTGSALLEALNAFVREHGIRAGTLSGIGALSQAHLGTYLQEEQRYESRTFTGDLEIVSLAGNISLKEGRPFVHAHLSISDHQLCVHGGHLMEGTVVFVAEIAIVEFTGPPPERLLDPATGLALWPTQE